MYIVIKIREKEIFPEPRLKSMSETVNYSHLSLRPVLTLDRCHSVNVYRLHLKITGAFNLALYDKEFLSTQAKAGSASIVSKGVNSDCRG